VPISITAISAKILDQGPVRDITDVVQIAPAVNGSANSSAQPLNAIRGIGSNDFSIGADPGRGIYVNEVYTARSAGAVQKLVYIERVEIIKGPQGMLFGRNTTAGAITPKPKTGVSEGRVRGAYGAVRDGAR
jgi:iron complex outermembrane recepter protein